MMKKKEWRYVNVQSPPSNAHSIVKNLLPSQKPSPNFSGLLTLQLGNSSKNHWQSPPSALHVFTFMYEPPSQIPSPESMQRMVWDHNVRSIITENIDSFRRIYLPIFVMSVTRSLHLTQSPSSNPHSGILKEPPSHFPSPKVETGIWSRLGSLWYNGVQLGYLALISVQSPPSKAPEHMMKG